MTIRRVELAGLVLLSVALSVTGCGFSVAKRAYQEVRGATASIKYVSDVRSDTLAKYQSIRFEPVTSSLGPQLAPPALLQAWDEAAREQGMELREFFPGGSPALRVKSEILYFQRKGIMSGAECLSRLRMYEDGSVVADIVVRAESEAFRAGGEHSLSEACAKAIARFLIRQKKAEELEHEKED